ncbi:MAG: hypothetical protein ACK5NA_08930 [Enterococcus sp.]
MYRHTKVEEYLSIAKELSNYFIQNIIQTDYIAKVDFKAPDLPEFYDTSAGLCAACGFLEIAHWVSAEEKSEYLHPAIQIVQSTEQKYANWLLEEDGIIGGGTEAYHRLITNDVPLIYSDYFFIEVLLKLNGKDLFIW